MKWHCGVLSENPDKDRRMQWIRRGWWREGLPDDIAYELNIWLAMPGIPAPFHAKVLGVNAKLVRKHLGRFEQYRAEVTENWLSITRDDCRRLAAMCDWGNLPLFVQLRLMEDMGNGMTTAQVARDYGIKPDRLSLLRTRGAYHKGPLPPEFSLLRGVNSKSAPKR